MGTEIQLTVSDVSLSYSKNHMGCDYGFLFQPSDLARRPSDAISYEYYADHPEEERDLLESELGFVRPLSRVLPRLRVLGHTVEGARAEYQATIEDAASLSDSDDQPGERQGTLTFEEFCALACRYSLASLSNTYIEYETKGRGLIAQGRFADHAEEFAHLPWTDDGDSYWSESSYLSAKLCILSAESMLQVFGLNPDNADAEVTWQFGPIVQAGWVERDAFSAGAQRTQSLLVVTEGSSDARILRRALDLLRPDVADFFRFIDADERHHFWGASNLVKFAEGLLRIDIQNQVMFLLDNDTEGVHAYHKLQGFKMPGNMRSMVLPDLDVFRSFPARGPEGLHACDINGRAVAIECYLALSRSEHPPAQVIWTNYKKDIDAWHGALEHKESYKRDFLDQDAQNLTNGTYDTSKLVTLLDAIIEEALRLST